jgi:hypothetical protein
VLLEEDAYESVVLSKTGCEVFHEDAILLILFSPRVIVFSFFCNAAHCGLSPEGIFAFCCTTDLVLLVPPPPPLTAAAVANFLLQLAIPHHQNGAFPSFFFLKIGGSANKPHLLFLFIIASGLSLAHQAHSCQPAESPEWSADMVKQSKKETVTISPY